MPQSATSRYSAASLSRVVYASQQAAFGVSFVLSMKHSDGVPSAPRWFGAVHYTCA